MTLPEVFVTFNDFVRERWVRALAAILFAPCLPFEVVRTFPATEVVVFDFMVSS